GAPCFGQADVLVGPSGEQGRVDHARREPTVEDLDGVEARTRDQVAYPVRRATGDAALSPPVGRGRHREPALPVDGFYGFDSAHRRRHPFPEKKTEHMA